MTLQRAYEGPPAQVAWLLLLVGVAYGSPVRDVVKLMKKAACEHGRVLNSPEPLVLFEEFADNSLNFELHFWIRMRTLMQGQRIESDVRHTRVVAGGEKSAEIQRVRSKTATGIVVAADKLVEVATVIRDELGYNYLASATAVDYLGNGDSDQQLRDNSPSGTYVHGRDSVAPERE